MNDPHTQANHTYLHSLCCMGCGNTEIKPPNFSGWDQTIPDSDNFGSL